MRKLMLAAALGLISLSGVAIAGASQDERVTYMCLEPSGASRPAVCDRVLNTSGDDFCRCPPLTTKVRAEFCADGETPPGQSAAFERARREAARDGSLIGDEYDGRRMCAKKPAMGRYGQ